MLQGSLFGLVGLLPQKYSTIFMSGQGLAGTFAALAMLLAIGSKSRRCPLTPPSWQATHPSTLSSGDADSETEALGYFITPCVGTLVTLVSYLLLPHLVSGRPPSPRGPALAAGPSAVKTQLCCLLQEFARFYLKKSSKYESAADLPGWSTPPTGSSAPKAHTRLPQPRPRDLSPAPRTHTRPSAMPLTLSHAPGTLATPPALVPDPGPRP